MRLMLTNRLYLVCSSIESYILDVLVYDNKSHWRLIVIYANWYSIHVRVRNLVSLPPKSSGSLPYETYSQLPNPTKRSLRSDGAHVSLTFYLS